MLRSAVIRAAALLIAFAPMAGAEDLGRIGIYDLWQILQVIPPAPVSEDKFHGPEGEAVRDEIRRKKAELDEADADAAERLRREGEIIQLRRDLYALKPSGVKSAQRDNERIKAALVEYGEENGFTVLIERKKREGVLGVVLLMTPGEDVTADIIRKLGGSAEQAAALRAAREPDPKSKEKSPIR